MFDSPAFSPSLAQAFSSTLSLQSPPSQPTPTPSLIEALPFELLEKIAAAVCRQTPTGPPTALLSLLLLSRRFYDVLGPRNEGFYSDLFRERFDWRSAERRWAQMKTIEDKREKKALLEGVTELRPAEDLKLTYGSFTRPSSPTEYLVESSSSWRPFTSRDFAVEFKRRCTVLTRMRRAAMGGQIPPSSSRPSSPRLQAFTPKGNRTTLSEPDELTQNLWTCYLMLLENDSKNLDHLVDYACLRTYMRLFYKHSLLSEALNPGWPRQTAGRALGLWIGWLGGDDLSSESPVESDERFFVLKPYVFGAHKFDAFHVPWTIPSLPVSHESHPVLPPPVGPFNADLRPRTQAQLITHMGRRIEMAPPILTHAAIFSFFYRVEQDPAASTDLMATPVGAPAHLQMGPMDTSRNVGPSTLSSKPVKTSLPVLASRIHDGDFARLASCVDPYSSRGLPALRTRGELAGSWEGRFSFFDFDSYKDMLGGRMRSLYEGPFGDQPQVWKIEEKIVRLKKGEKQGGKGPTLNAGYEIGSLGPARSSSLSQSPPPPRPATLATGPSTSHARGNSNERTPTLSAAAVGGGAPLGNRRKSVDGAGEWSEETARASKRPRSIVIHEEDVREEQEDEDGDYEILLTGSGHSAWGQFLLKGRVRSYDGMFSITKEYTPDSRGRWLYRGYCVGGNLVGRWRDTHTPLDLHGYEGTFLMTRRA